MSNKILSFEEFAERNKSRLSDTTNNSDADELEDETEELEDEVEDLEDEIEDEEQEEPEDEEQEESEDEEQEDAEDEEQEESEDAEKTEESADVNVSEMLKEMYEKACDEAKQYESDDYVEHTVEAYCKEMATMHAGMMIEMYEKACNEVKEGDMTLEMYEAACNEMSEAYKKRMDELKEEYTAK